VSKVSIGAGIGLALGLVGLALSLSNYKNETLARWLLIGAGVVLGLSGVVSLARYGRAPYDRAVEGRVEQVLSAKLAELQQAPGSPAPQVPAPEPAGVSLVNAEADLRAPVNHVVGELQDVAEHIQADDHRYWEGGYLPTFEWGRYRDQIVRKADEAYQATRAAYRQIERVERCIQDQRVGNDVGDVWLPEDATVAQCRPDEALSAITHAASMLRELSR
jgi:hypothetical protein